MTTEDKGLERYYKDWPLIALVLAFIALLAAFFKGDLDYPIGWLLLPALIYIRIQNIRKSSSKPTDRGAT